MISQLIEPQNEVSLLYGMLLIRRIEEALIAEYPKQEMRCPVHFSIGQEAIAVGVCSELKIADIEKLIDDLEFIVNKNENRV